MSQPANCQPKAIALLGPTASGKTQLAISLARRLPLALISVDSVMIYRGMDIGSAKPSPALLKQYPHALIDLLDPAETWSAAQFVRAAVRAVAQARQQGRIPLLVGGAMLYFRSLLYGLTQLPPADEAVRRRLRQGALTQGWQALHDRLAECDAVSAARIHPADAKRIERALEVFELTGRPLSQWQQQGKTGAVPAADVLLLAVQPSRPELHRRIDGRLQQMLADGLIEEVEALYRRGDLTADMPSVRSIGYRQVWRWLQQGKRAADYPLMQQQIGAATRTYARRQENWLRRFANLCHVADARDVMRQVERAGLI